MPELRRHRARRLAGAGQRGFDKSIRAIEAIRALGFATR